MWRLNVINQQSIPTTFFFTAARKPNRYIIIYRLRVNWPVRHYSDFTIDDVIVYRNLLFISLQDLKNQILTTNVWVEHVSTYFSYLYIRFYKILSKICWLDMFASPATPSSSFYLLGWLASNPVAFNTECYDHAILRLIRSMTLVYSEWTLYRLEAREINFRSAIHLNLERLRWHNKRTKVCFCLFFFPLFAFGRE